MNITLLTYGSRGDVQPFLPLSLGLMTHGHTVILAAPAGFKNLVEEHGITFFPLAGDPEELSRRLNDAGYNPFKQARELLNHAIEIGADILRQTDEACRNADLIVHSFTHAVGAHTLAREKNIPDVHVQTFPMFNPTGDYPHVSMPDFRIRFLNRLTHKIAEQFSMLAAQMGFEQVRRKAGLPRRNLYSPFKDSPPRPRTPILCAWSPSLIPPSSDWEPHVRVAGYFFLPYNTSYAPSDELKMFLESGTAPVCISFGSMIHKDAQNIDGIMRAALKRTKNRAVVLSGWGSVKREATGDLLYLESAPHDWLLPKCRMLIHHGGAGTTAAGLRAGIPQVVVPFMADQPFWGNRVHAVGAAPKPIRVNQLSAERMVKAMAEAESKALLERAQATGQRIRGEDGVGEAVRLIESQAAAFQKLARFFKV
ncbi:MAG: O-mycaminosyltylonolide 6-deoxyallosyltransferase [Anaerolineales bacterium]|nr:O-mycaminosyltylonolide 6-deoxyallosyltransferase [Anaerolineales bacterium]